MTAQTKRVPPPRGVRETRGGRAGGRIMESSVGYSMSYRLRANGEGGLGDEPDEVQRPRLGEVALPSITSRELVATEGVAEDLLAQRFNRPVAHDRPEFPR